MFGSQSRKLFTDSQLKTQLTKLDPDKQHEFLRFSDPLFDRESDIYLNALAESRASLAQALAKIQSELESDADGDDGDEGDEGELDENMLQMGSKAALFDTTTDMGKQMAAISRAFSELLQDTELGDAKVRRKAKRAETKAMKQYMKNLEDESVAEDEEGEKNKRERKSKKKKKKTRGTIKNALDEELISTLKTNLATELSAAAKEEQDAILEKMKNHGRKIDRERKRQKDLLNERIRDARNKKSIGADAAYADAVGSLLVRRDELDDMHQQDRSRQQKALKDRLTNRKQTDNYNLTEPPESTDQQVGDTEDGTTKKNKKKKSSKRSTGMDDLGNAEEQMEESSMASSEVPTQITVNEMDDNSSKKKKHKQSKKNKSDPSELEDHNASEKPPAP